MWRAGTRVRLNKRNLPLHPLTPIYSSEWQQRKNSPSVQSADPEMLYHKAFAYALPSLLQLVNSYLAFRSQQHLISS